VDRRTVLIISDEPEFGKLLKSRWQEKGTSFMARNSDPCDLSQVESFDFAILGKVKAERLDPLLTRLASSGKPAIHVCKTTQPSGSNEVINLPQVEGWPEALSVVADLALELHQARAVLAAREQERVQLEQQASLGRYMIEARHNFNNALTSVLGNSDLLMMEAESLDLNLRAQVETIRNMAMRMNEIMQRFSSLQKEMQLVEQQVWKKKAKSAGA